MQFIHQPLTWGFLLVLLPLLIHLINMMRHRRVQWAAMDFLLQSYKRHRKWIWLKQLLLLLMRMAAIALAVGMLAQWITRDQWLDLFGTKSVHHFVLLDDSFSMTERSGAVSAFDAARQVVGRIANRAGAAEQGGQKLTLLRFSKASKAAGSGTKISTDDEATKLLDQIADFNAEPISTTFDVELQEKQNNMQATQLPVGPRDVLSLLRQLLEKDAKDKHVVYVVSDFRAKDWGAPKELKESLRELEKNGAELHLVNCTKAAQQNLAIVSVQPGEETRAAGVPLFVNVQVKNFGPGTAKRVPLKVRSLYYGPEVIEIGPDNATAQAEELPTMLIDEIKPGETATTRVQVYFPKPGQHAVEASLPDDAVTTDNRRWAVVDFPDGEPVLIIDGSPLQRPSYYLTSVFQPSQRANTGIRATVQRPAFLRDTSAKDLVAYRAIYVADVDRFDKRMVENLEEYVRGGGGLGIFIGDNAFLSSYNQELYRGGEGLLPLPLDRIDLLPPEASDNVADIEVTDHPVFSAFLGESNPFIRLVAIERYARPRPDWNPPTDSTVQIIARLRNRQPLAVERTFGAGRVVTFLTSLAPDWNNWAQDPSFIVTQLKLQSYLAASSRQDEKHPVGAPLTLRLDAAKYRPEMKFVMPGEKSGARVVMDRNALRPDDKQPTLAIAFGQASDASSTGETDRGGLYETWLNALSGAIEPRRFALNVDQDEGDLAILESQELLAKLAPISAKFHQADEYAWDAAEQNGFNRSLMLMCLLIALLLGEQLVAYSASYHPAQLGDLRGGVSGPSGRGGALSFAERLAAARPAKGPREDIVNSTEVAP